MDTDILRSKFDAIGSRLKIGSTVRRFQLPPAITLDVRRDDRGEYFELRLDNRQVERVDAVDVRPNRRHLLLLAWVRRFRDEQLPRWPNWRTRPEFPTTTREPLAKPRFLCGHDERHWFAAAIPEVAHASNVQTAMEALKPRPVLEAQAARSLSLARRQRRKNPAFVRQGEWFFLPQPNLIVPAAMVRTNEPLQRSGGKAHWAEFAFRFGGETVYVSRSHPAGLTLEAYGALMQRNPKNSERFRIMQRNATLYVRGRIRHPDHATIRLNVWHEVAMNTENQAEARKNVVFLD